MTGCSVVGCRSRFVKGGKHFFRFPKDYRSDIWVQFTRKGANFKPKQAAGICQDHFVEPFFIKKKKGQTYLLKDAVPTIFYRDTRTHVSERVEIEYDPESQQYIGEESTRMLKGIISIEDEKAIIQQRSDKLKELKTLCRFCLFSKDEVKCVPLTKLEAYGIDETEMLITIGIGRTYDEIMSSIICEKCFQHLVSLDAFKTRCKRAQDEIVAEMKEFDTKLQDVRDLFASERRISVDDETQRQYHQNETIKAHGNDKYNIPIEIATNKFQEVFIKSEPKEDAVQQRIDTYEDSRLCNGNDPDIVPMERIKDDSDGSEVFEPIIKEAPRKLRIYECFLCQKKFDGQRTYISHQCSVTERSCRIKDCPRKFSRMNLYNLHVCKFHGLQKLSKQYCSMCNNVAILTETEFKQHTKECNKKALSQENFIECEICKKKCPTLKSYTIHKLFHDSKNLIESTLKVKRWKRRPGSEICELCGKNFASSPGLYAHRRNVHMVGSKGETYHCDICGKFRPNRAKILNHLKNVHCVQETPCSVCGKVFRTKALVQKHMIYHTESRRIHKCDMCPDKPPYFTNVALQRHQRSHHFKDKAYACNIEDCQHAYVSKHQLKVHKRNIHGIRFK